MLHGVTYVTHMKIWSYFLWNNRKSFCTVNVKFRLVFFLNIVFAICVKDSLFETRFTSIRRTSVPACLSVRLYVFFISHKNFLIVTSVCTWLVRSFAGRLQEGFVFDSRPIHVRLVMDKVTLGHIFLWVRPLSCAVFIPLVIHTLIKLKEWTASLNYTSKWGIEHYIDM